jgi:hypothetical protein
MIVRTLPDGKIEGWFTSGGGRIGDILVESPQAKEDWSQTIRSPRCGNCNRNLTSSTSEIQRFRGQVNRFWCVTCFRGVAAVIQEGAPLVFISNYSAPQEGRISASVEELGRLRDKIQAQAQTILQNFPKRKLPRKETK